ncbi:type I restriction-modification system subunit M [Phascolarctobacterium faecium]|nr:type I restriction-modification system subunit M [Phascolarctobacterium faecium]MDM8109270.1 type I restriction-modification system subunit M [Phascolarctobacterium faecium]
MNKQQLASKIWESANKMRSKIEANEYKDYILGFIFYKFLSDKEVKYLKENDWTDEYLPELDESDAETVTSVQKNIGYFIPYQHLFSTWLDKGNDFTADDVTVALSSFSRLVNESHKVVFENIFKTLETGLSKLGDTSGARTKAIRGLINLIKDIPMDGKQDYDVLGFIYEYLISNFAANAGKKAGEFYTPHEVSLLMSELIAHHLKDRDKIEIYDPTSGSGSLLINIGQCAAKYMSKENNIKYYAQELKENTYNLTRMNLVMRGILPDNIVTRNGDTLEDDWPYFDDKDPVNTYNPLYVDAVVSNPPYSQAWDPSDKELDKRYSRFGLAPKSKADYAFLLHDLYHLKPDGIMAIVLPHGVLFRGGEEGKIRQNLIEYNHIDAIIGLPANIFFGTGIPTIIMVLKQKRDNTDVLIVDASKGFAKVGKNNMLRACDIKKIVDAVTARADIDKFSKKVSRDTIRQNDYNLNIPRYVDSSEKAESWDIYASMFGGIPESELQDLQQYWQAFPNLKTALFKAVNSGYWQLNAYDLKETIKKHPDVLAFKQNYSKVFADFNSYLATELVDNAAQVNISKEVTNISDNIFARLQNVLLVDRYEAYQLLDDNWKDIAIDLEIIQTEGMTAVKQVDPNFVLKKKNGKDEEVQEGWKGHVLPFDLVQKTMLPEELAELKAKEDKLNTITGEYDSLLEELSEDDKSQPFVNEAGDAFVAAEVKKAIKAKAVEAETLVVLKKVQNLMDEEKAIKKEVKDGVIALHLKTKEVIEELTDEQGKGLLKEKWIVPLTESINSLPDAAINGLVSKLEAICKKYETTFADVEKEIAETEQSLIAMLDELEGNEFDMQGIAELKALLGGK